MILKRQRENKTNQNTAFFTLGSNDGIMPLLWKLTIKGKALSHFLAFPVCAAFQGHQMVLVDEKKLFTEESLLMNAEGIIEP